MVVDGASTDRTWEVCRAFADRDPRVRIFRDPEYTGPVRGWWRCIEEARGRFATFLWSDDVLMATFLEHTLPFVADEDVAFAYTAAEIGLRPGEGRVAYAIPGTSELASDAFIRGSLTTRGRFPMSPACALFRLTDLKRNFVTEVSDSPADLTSTGAGVDLLFYLLTASQRPRVHHVSVPLAFFRAHPNSISIDGRGGLARPTLCRRQDLVCALTRLPGPRAHRCSLALAGHHASLAALPHPRIRRGPIRKAFQYFAACRVSDANRGGTTVRTWWSSPATPHAES